MKKNRTYQLRSMGIAIMAICALVVSSCTKELELPVNNKEKKIVLLGELIADEPVYIRCAQSLSLSTTASRFEVPEGLSAILYDNGDQVALTGKKDSLSASLASIPFTAPYIVKPSAQYRLSVSHPVMDTATVNLQCHRE